MNNADREILQIVTDLKCERDEANVEVERLRAALAETEVERDHFHDAITEYNRVIAKIEARYEEQGQYNHELVRRLAALVEIAEAVARLRAEHFTSVVVAYYAADVEPIQAKARALLAQNDEASQ